ncbi:MAG: CooT family nickel-binding protein [Deltaproteobacteria bacterium]|nr:CooT family nickel-binding protein [Deltaproteobacteria bacterium]
MCESTAYLLKDAREEMVFEDIESLENSGGEIKMISIFGEEKTIRARPRRFSLVDHKIVLEPQ